MEDSWQNLGADEIINKYDIIIMYVTSLELSNVRCFGEVAIKLSKNVNILVGNNNSGKSTILKAISNLQTPFLGREAIKINADQSTINIGIKNDSNIYKFGQLEYNDDKLSGFRVVINHYINSTQPTSSVFFNEETFDSTTAHNITFSPFPNVEPYNVIFPYFTNRKAVIYKQLIRTCLRMEINAKKAESAYLRG